MRTVGQCRCHNHEAYTLELPFAWKKPLDAFPDFDAPLYPQGTRQGAKFSLMGHVLMVNRSGLILAETLT
jgi:hypothetical protein